MNGRPCLLLFFFVSLAGCVSKTTYQALSTEHNRIKNDSLLLEKRIRQLEDDNQRLITESAKMEQALNNRLQEKQDSLAYKEQLLHQREMSLKDMKARKEEEQEAFTTLATQVFSGFSGYSADTLTTHTNCTGFVIRVNDRALFVNGSRPEAFVQEIHTRAIQVLRKYPDLHLSVVTYADSLTGKEKNNDPLNTAYARGAMLYKSLAADKTRSVKERISVAVQNESAPRTYPQQTDYVFFSRLLPCIHIR